jgi:UDP-arabinose 4-epimerase
VTRTVLVTGGAGYVGSHCCKAFAQAGWTVVVYDNLSRGWRDFVKWGPLVEGDLLDAARLTAVIGETKPDVVAHFAALAYVGESVLQPHRYWRTNVCGTLNLLHAMQRSDVSCIVFSSTCATYGAPVTLPISEDTEQRPINPYGWSKLAVEKILDAQGHAHGLRSVALRYFNAAGADPDGEIGERHKPETHLIPLALQSSLPGETALTIFGNDYETPDGTAIRDFIHVRDLASAHLAAIDHLAAGRGSERINLGTGRGVSVAELVAAVERATGQACRTLYGPRREGDPAALVACASRAQELLGWRPVRSDIDQIVADALMWELKEREGFGSSPS